MKGELCAIAILLGMTACTSKQRQPDLTCAVIHRPPSGCPNDYSQEAEPRFTERDGSKEFACIAQVPKDNCTDVLKAGESETIRLLIRKHDSMVNQ